MKPPVSNWFDAPRPSLRNSQRAPTSALPSGLNMEYSVIGCVHAI